MKVRYDVRVDLLVSRRDRKRIRCAKRIVRRWAAPAGAVIGAAGIVWILGAAGAVETGWTDLLCGSLSMMKGVCAAGIGACLSRLSA